jgi:hypothetical protein
VKNKINEKPLKQAVKKWARKWASKTCAMVFGWYRSCINFVVVLINALSAAQAGLRPSGGIAHSGR